jgi:hypothetical protein
LFEKISIAALDAILRQISQLRQVLVGRDIRTAKFFGARGHRITAPEKLLIAGFSYLVRLGQS